MLSSCDLRLMATNNKTSPVSYYMFVLSSRLHYIYSGTYVQFSFQMTTLLLLQEICEEGSQLHVFIQLLFIVLTCIYSVAFYFFNMYLFSCILAFNMYLHSCVYFYIILVTAAAWWLIMPQSSEIYLFNLNQNDPKREEIHPTNTFHCNSKRYSKPVHFTLIVEFIRKIILLLLESLFQETTVLTLSDLKFIK